MKKATTLLKILPLLLFAFFTGCTNESDTTMNTEESAVNNESEIAYRGSVWDGDIGTDEGNGNYVITASPELLLNDLNDILDKEGNSTTLTSLAIVKKKATNAIDYGYMLIASDKHETSIGVWLHLSQGKFSLIKGAASISTSCRGCASGCNLEYLLIDGQRIAYCNENGCYYNCTKTESEFF